MQKKREAKRALSVTQGKRGVFVEVLAMVGGGKAIGGKSEGEAKPKEKRKYGGQGFLKKRR